MLPSSPLATTEATGSGVRSVEVMTCVRGLRGGWGSVRSLVHAGVLTLACTSDLTDPQPPRNPLTQVITSTDLTPLPVASVVASGDDGNIPQNTLDNNLATRWSASGDGQWIRYDLGAVMAVGPVTIAWYRGTEWASAFDIEVSLDSLTWTRAFTGRSSGQTLQPERYDFPAVPGRYVRI